VGAGRLNGAPVVVIARLFFEGETDHEPVGH
jgi:hypothetical protein